MDCVAGIDIGTTSTAAILIALPNRVLATASRPTTLHSPRAGWAEQEPEEWWENTCAVTRELLRMAGSHRIAVQGIGITGMLPAVVLLDERGEVLRPAIQQSDGRCGAEVRELAAEVDERDFLRRTGNGVNQQLVAAKLRWIEKHEPEVWAGIATVFGSYDYINWKLTGKKAVEQNWALEAGFADMAGAELSDALIALAHVRRDVIPPIVRSHAVLGPLASDAADATGLPAGIPVAGGAADHIASCFAAGIIHPGDVLLKFGGSTDILVASREARPDPRMFLDYHLIPGMYVPNGCMACGGSALNWFVDTLGRGERPRAERAGLTLHQHLDAIAAETPPGAEGVQVIPYFLGEKTPLHDPDARGIIHGLSLNHDVRHLWRALLEGFGHAFRHHVEVLNDMGHPTTRYFATDGGASSTFWMQICADILQTPIRRLEGHPGSCLGAAWTAAVAAGLTSDWAGIADYVSPGDVIWPDAANRTLHDASYRRFRQSYEAYAAVRMEVPA